MIAIKFIKVRFGGTSNLLGATAALERDLEAAEKLLSEELGSLEQQKA